jgi:NAD(P)-dependent dehydrogenase (short-subunit alcohol dehydrogenase family)
MPQTYTLQTPIQQQAVVITGAAQGIGLSIAVAFAKLGAKIALIDTQKEKLSKACTQISQFTAEVKGVPIDVSNSQMVHQGFQEIASAFGGIHVLVNNAGIHHTSSFLEITETDWDRVMAINLKGVFLCSQAASKIMIKHQIPGTIINLGSIAGLTAIGTNAAYATSKAGIIQLSRNLAVELAPHQITVNVVNPGAVSTAMMKKLFEDPVIRQANLQHIPLNRLATPEEIASLITYLASSSARYLTGAMINIDGGWMAQGL